MAEDILKLLSAKLDSIDKRLATLETPPKPKEDAADPRLVKSETALRDLLKGSFKEDALKAMPLEELLIAATLKGAYIVPSPQFIDPPTGTKPKLDAEDKIDVPIIFRAHNDQGEVI